MGKVYIIEIGGPNPIFGKAILGIDNMCLGLFVFSCLDVMNESILQLRFLQCVIVQKNR